MTDNKLKVGETITNNMKNCSYCNNGNCRYIKTRAVLNNFTNVSFCVKTRNTIQFTKSKEA